MTVSEGVSVCDIHSFYYKECHMHGHGHGHEHDEHCGVGPTKLEYS